MEMKALPLIDSQVTLDGRTYTVVGHNANDDYAPDFILRMDIDGNDAAYSTGECGVDWEYIYVPVTDAWKGV